MKYHNSLIRIAKIKKTNRRFATEDVELEISCILVRMHNCSVFQKANCQFFVKLNILLSYILGIPLLSSYTREMETCV